MTINPASMPTVPPGSKDALPQQATLGDIPVGAAQKVGDYKILGMLGSGGMGVVYKAFDQKLGRVVALKMLQFGHENNPEEMVRFRTEAETLGRLQHPNIVQVFDFGVHEGAPFLVMEFVSGGSLDKKLQGVPQPPRRAAELIEQLARAVHAAHENKVVHRDLKPANVLLGTDGMPKITDFGLAKRMEVSHGLTQTGAIMGTPSYMAPEQAEGKKDVGAAADVYSLGAMLYECLTGRPPFRGATLQETLEQVCHADPAPPSKLVPRLPRDLQTVCLKCLEKPPGRRYSSALELADDLKNYLEGMPVKARPTHSIERLIRIVARRPLRAALVAASMLVIILAVVLGLVVRDMNQREEANRQQLAYEREVNQQKAAAQQARQAEEDARKSLQNLKDMLGLTLQGDLNTPAGLDRLEKKLREHAQSLKKGGSGPDKSLVLAGAYARLASLWREQGEADRALQILDEAEELARASSAADHGDYAAEMQRARIYQGRGLLRSETGGAEAAVKDCNVALELLAEVKEAGSDKPDFLRLRAETLHDLAVATSGLPADSDATRCQNYEAAQKSYLEALTLLRSLVARPDASDDDQRNLARTLGYLGDLYLDLDKRQEADDVYWESHHIREDLARAKPRRYERRYQLARSWDNFGGYQTRQRILGTALHFYRQSEKERRDLHQKQPDNKEYVLELTGVLNRIAELELFGADQGADVKKLTQAEGLLRECSKLLTELLEVVQEETRTDRGATTRAYSRLGECHTLQARAGLIRLALVPDSKEVLEETRSAARAAGDNYAKVKDRRKLSREELYQQAAAQFMSLEIYLQTRAENVKNSASFYDQPIKMLTDSVVSGFRRLAPEEMARDRAFRSVADKKWFQSLLAQAALKPGSRSAPANGESHGKDS